jgi:uncharacterized protein (DUF1499 family)
MKTVLITLSILFLAFAILLFWFRAMPRPGAAPGLVDGMLSKCPNKPNCVCSEYKDESHYISPVEFPQDSSTDVVSLVKNTIRDMGGSIEVETADYIAATFTSKIFKFVDDFEVRIDSVRKLIHIRSASRIGYSDLNVNLKRTESFKKRIYSPLGGGIPRRVP